MPHILDLREQSVSSENALSQYDTENEEMEEHIQPRETQHSPTSSSSLSYTWEAHEYELLEKSADWYWALGIVAVGLVAAAVIMNNLLFGIFVLLGAFTLMMFAAKKPRIVSFGISEKGIVIDTKLYPYDTLKSFWIFYNPPHKELSVESQRALMPHIKIPLGSANPLRIREMLLTYVPEKKQEESLIDIGARYLRF